MPTKIDENRMLSERGGIYYYYRRVPENLKGSDDRYPFIRKSLKTSDIVKARVLRDQREQHDNEYWALLHSDDESRAKVFFEAAQKRATALGFSYQPALAFLQSARLDEVEARLRVALDKDADQIDRAAGFGLVNTPVVTVSKALKIYFSDITRDDIKQKSPGQAKSWMRHKQRAVNTFVDVVGNVAISDISREQALLFFNFWMNRTNPTDGSKRYSGSAGNREMSDMRVLFERYHRHIGVDAINPFADLRFNDAPTKAATYSTSFIKSKFLKTDALAKMNDEARAIVLIMIGTGARPSEIANLRSRNIYLKVDVPYIDITPSTNPDDPYEVKTKSAVRKIPLVGVALAAMRKHPKGFHRYRDNANSFSAAANKYFAAKGLRETPEHTVYALRHNFEDRMKEAGLDGELRRYLFGHSEKREMYGTGGSKAWQRDELLKVSLPFDPGIV